MTKLHIAALGSSFAAGPSIEPIENKAAGRSTRNYAHQLAEALDAQLTDLSVSGATLLNVLHDKQTMGGQTFDAQLDHLPADADIVTLTCGGNDLNYIGGLVYDSLMSYLGPLKRVVPGQTKDPPIQLDELRNRFLAVLDKIHDIAPKAKVYLVEYLTIIGNDTRPWLDIALTAEQMKHYADVAVMLSTAYNDAAKSRSFAEIIPVARSSNEHALGSRVPWVEGFNLSMLMRGVAPYHPNLAGHTAIAEMLRERVSQNK